VKPIGHDIVERIAECVMLALALALQVAAILEALS